MNPELETQPRIPRNCNDIEALASMKGLDGTILDQADFKNYQDDMWELFCNHYEHLHLTIKHSIDQAIADALSIHKTPYALLKHLYEMFQPSSYEQELALVQKDVARLTAKGLGNKGLGAFLLEMEITAIRAA
jgi:hypothetical protein